MFTEIIVVYDVSHTERKDTFELTEFRIIYVKKVGTYPYAQTMLEIMTSVIPVMFNVTGGDTGREIGTSHQGQSICKPL
jgi:hypothetical protein